MKKLLTLISFLFLCAGCGTPHVVRDAISAADSLAEERPDSALNLMRRVERRKLRSAKDRALYALVYSKVLDKNCVDVDRDSMIRPCVDYYAEHGPADRRALAYYYWGRTLENADSTSRAIEAFTLARRALGDDTLCRTFALICNRLGDAHEAQYEFESAARMFRSSAATFAALGEEYNEMIGYQRLVINAIRRNDYSHAEDWNDKLIKSAEVIKDTSSIFAGYTYKANIEANWKNNYTNAKKILLFARENFYMYASKEIDLLIGKIYLVEKQLDSARLFFTNYRKSDLSVADSVGYLELQGFLEYSARNYKRSSEYRDSIIRLQDSVFKVQQQLSIEEIGRKYDYSLLKHQVSAERQMHKYRFILAILSIVIILILSIVIIY